MERFFGRGGKPSRWLGYILVLGSLLSVDSAYAHWCDCLWASSYNLVVKPESDEVVVPSSGSVDLDVWVQNNMAYPLVGFTLYGSASGYTIDISNAAPKVTNYLMPGEKLRHTLTITASGGGTLAASEIEFSVDFGSGSQDGRYPYSTGEEVVIRANSGSLSPSGFPSLGQAGGQALHLGSSAAADYGSSAAVRAGALDDLLQEYCSGRGSWNSSGSVLRSTYCPSASQTEACPTSPTRGDSKYDWQHLWAAEQLGARKGELTSSQLSHLRTRLMCGYDDTNFGFKTVAAVVLGYLGEDSGSRSFLQAVIDNTQLSAEERTVAKAAILLLGSASDLAEHREAVATGLEDSDAYVAMACATALGIVETNDAAVTDVLIARARWIQPDTSDNGEALSAAHLLDLVAWERRGYTPLAADTGSVRFYEEAPDTVDPEAPASASCVPGSGTAQISWPQVSIDVDGQPETVSFYEVYYGKSPRPGACSGPGGSGCSGFDYSHSNSSALTYINLGGLDEGDTYYFAVLAVDSYGNRSLYSPETSCTIPETAHPPVAALSCSPSSGTVPPTLTVTCDATGSTDPDGAGDIEHYYFSLNGGAEVDESDGVLEYQFDAAANHSITVRVVDQGGLEDSDSASVAVTAFVNHAPEASAAATPDSGDAPLEVAFSSAGSSDPDGDAISYHWDFDDGGASSTQANPSHTFSSDGTYQVTLTVSDDRSPSLSGTAVVYVEVTRPLVAPVADVVCTPASGAVPPNLAVTCSGTGSSDSDGTVDQYFFSLDGAAEVEESDGVVEYLFDAVANHTITLRVVDNDGQEDSDNASVEVTAAVNHAPEAHAAATPTSGDAPLEVTFSSAGSLDPDDDSITYLWNFGDSSADSTEANPTHTYTSEGLYLVTLTVTDDRTPAASGSDTVTVNVTLAQDPPTAVLVCTPSSGEAPLAVTCDATSSTDPQGTGDISGYYFALNGAAEQQESDGIIEYNLATVANHTVVVRVVDSVSQEDSVTATVSVTAAVGENQAPVAVAGGSPRTGQVPLEVTFSSAGTYDPDTGDSISYSWDFGDGSPLSSQENPVHTYTTPGSYTATLRVTDDGEPVAFGTATVGVDVEALLIAPVAALSCTPTTGQVPPTLTVVCSGAASSDGNGASDIVSHFFSLDGATAVDESDAEIEYQFDTMGNYNVSLRVVDSAGLFALDSTTIQVTAATNQAPVAVMAATPLSGDMPLTVTFSSAGSNDPDGDNLTYLWDFGDGSPTSDELNPSHQYTAAGNFIATLRVTDDGAPSAYGTDSETIVVNTVQNAPTAVLNCSPTSGQVPPTLTVSCDGTASTDPDGAGDIVEYSFSLDGTAAVVEADGRIEYNFDSAGNHTIVLRVVDSTDLAATASATVQVQGSGNSAPVAVIAATPLSGEAPLAVSFGASGSSDPDNDNLSYAWDFGDNTGIVTDSSTSHTYATAGSYTVILTVTDDGSPPASGSDTVTIQVTNPVENVAPTLTTASVSPLFGQPPLSVHFDATGVTDPNGDNFTLQWDFGDGSAASASDSTDHIFTDVGEYQVTLTAVDDGTPVATSSRDFTVTVSEQATNQAPDVAAATVTPLTGPLPLTLKLDASGCSDPDGDQLTYFWDVPVTMVESVTFDTAEAEYTYENPGEYDVLLKLSDNGTPPMERTKRFHVVVTEAQDEDASEVTLGEGWNCAGYRPSVSGGVAGFALWSGLFWFFLRRRR